MQPASKGDSSKFLGAGIGDAKRSELARIKGGVGKEDEIGKSKVQNGVANEFEALIGGRIFA